MNDDKDRQRAEDQFEHLNFTVLHRDDFTGCASVM
jgi:hypothetical protein